MPVLSMFFGIIIRMYNEAGGQHKLPHLHAEYQGQEVVVDFTGKVMTGEIPSNKMRMLLVWMEIHQEELIANWKLLSEGSAFFRIDPLK